jgi:ornithine lipid ester-linked acyl 2-hydroxylase
MMLSTLQASPQRRPLRVRVRKSVARFTRRRQDALERWFGQHSLVGNDPILDRRDFPWVERLEAAAPAIRRELEGVLGDRQRLPSLQDLSPTQMGITKGGDWKTFFFHAYGLRSERHCARCPETARALDSIPGLQLAFFSILAPHAHISAHKGVYKGLIRAHLGLVVPEPRDKVRMRVGDEIVVWEEGRCVVFDDTYNHEVWNDTDGIRVVLLIDVLRPFPPVLRALNKALIRVATLTPFVTRAARKHREWEQAFYGG